MEIVYVSSETIRAYQYIPEDRMLYIWFVKTSRKGNCCKYYNVPYDVFLAFSAASSKGGYFHQNIRNNYSFNYVNQ